MWSACFGSFLPSIGRIQWSAAANKILAQTSASFVAQTTKCLEIILNFCLKINFIASFYSLRMLLWSFRWNIRIIPDECWYYKEQEKARGGICFSESSLGAFSLILLSKHCLPFFALFASYYCHYWIIFFQQSMHIIIFCAFPYDYYHHMLRNRVPAPGLFEF